SVRAKLVSAMLGMAIRKWWVRFMSEVVTPRILNAGYFGGKRDTPIWVPCRTQFTLKRELGAAAVRPDVCPTQQQASMAEAGRMEQTALVWFRRDLRHFDHAALS